MKFKKIVGYAQISLSLVLFFVTYYIINSMLSYINVGVGLSGIDNNISIITNYLSSGIAASSILISLVFGILFLLQGIINVKEK